MLALANSLLPLLRVLLRAVRRIAPLLAVIMLLATGRGTADLVEQALCLATGIECCEGLCGGAGEDCTPTSCAHCACCAHGYAVVSFLSLLPGRPSLDERAVESRLDAMFSAGYRAPPFRPPLA